MRWPAGLAPRDAAFSCLSPPPSPTGTSGIFQGCSLPWGLWKNRWCWGEGALCLGDAGEGAPWTTYIPSSKGPRGWVLPGHFVLCRLQEFLCNRGGVRGAPAWGVRQGEARAHACGHSTRHPRVNLSGKCGVRTQTSRVIYGRQGPCPIDMALQARPHLFRTCWTLSPAVCGQKIYGYLLPWWQRRAAGASTILGQPGLSHGEQELEPG